MPPSQANICAIFELLAFLLIDSKKACPPPEKNIIPINPPTIKKNRIILVKTPLYKFELLKNIIRDSVYKIKAKRLVIDPGALFELFFDREIEVRKAIVELGDMLKKLGCTTIVTTEENGQFNQGNFSSDGIIYTYHTKLSNQFMRMIAVIKMRGTSHSEKIHPLRFTKNGLEVLSEEEVFQDVVTPNF